MKNKTIPLNIPLITFTELLTHLVFLAAHLISHQVCDPHVEVRRVDASHALNKGLQFLLLSLGKPSGGDDKAQHGCVVDGGRQLWNGFLVVQAGQDASWPHNAGGR